MGVDSERGSLASSGVEVATIDSGECCQHLCGLLSVHS